MIQWLPYRFGIWLAGHLRLRCYLCRLYPVAPSTSYSQSSIFDRASVARINTRSPSTSLLCQVCHQAIDWRPPACKISMSTPPFDSLHIQAATYYDYPINATITAFKHQEDMTKLPVLVHALRQLPRPKNCHGSNSVLVPMPTTDQRLRHRGFDPVTILSHYLSQHWQIPIWRGVARIDNASSQQGLSRAERLTNINDAFELIKPIPKAHLLLFDDVATTGATLRSLAETLSVTNDPPQLRAYAIAHGNQVT